MDSIAPKLDHLVIPECFGVIYSIRRTDSGRQYIGQALRHRVRTTIRKHFYLSEPNKHLRKDILELGKLAFSCSIVDVASSQQELDKKEIFLISNCPDKYNVALGGRWFTHDTEKHSQHVKQGMSRPEVRDRLSRRTKEQWADPEKRERLIAGCFSPETRHKRSEGAKKVWSDPKHRNNLLAVHNSPEGRQKHAKVANARWSDPEQRRLASERMKQQWQVKKNLTIPPESNSIFDEEKCQ